MCCYVQIKLIVSIANFLNAYNFSLYVVYVYNTEEIFVRRSVFYLAFRAWRNDNIYERIIQRKLALTVVLPKAELNI